MLAVGVGHLAFNLDTSVRGGLTSLLLAWVSGWLGLSSGAKLRAEFGAAAALLVSVPMFAVALLFGLRALRLLLGWVQAGGELITAPTDANVWLMIALFVLSVLLNLSLGSMVVLRLVRRLHHVSRHDALTGLLNRRAMQELMEAEHLRLLRGGAGFALLLIDVDHFKRVNDRFGHAVGDAALRAVARCLQAAVRRTDVLARFGGEEFCVLLRMTDAGGALELAQRLNDAVRATPLDVDTVQLPVTVSIGIAVTRSAAGRHELTIEKLLMGADRALYRAKAEGRDRLALATENELVESGFMPMAG
jgi:diguanylate cyclase (GGDEF)-like protein